MGYRVKFEKAVKIDIDKVKETYTGTPLPQRLDNWFEELANEAQNRKWSLSIDVDKFLTDAITNVDKIEEIVRSWPTVWQRFWNASALGKLKAASVVIAKRRPPYESRASMKSFKVFHHRCEVTVMYLVDHANKIVIILKIDGLPMQDFP